jgi:hypothetical protein
LLAAWAATINLDGTVGLIVQAAAEASIAGGDVDTLLVRGLGEADFSFAYQTFAGTAEVDVVADAATADAQVWFTAKQPNAPESWRVANNGVYPLTSTGLVERFDTAGLARMYVEIDNFTGPGADGAVAPSTFAYWARAVIGPSIDERTV